MRRADAMDTLESYSFVIVLYLSLLEMFPQNSAHKHWQVELNAFEKALQKVNNGKSGRHNLSFHSVNDFLLDQILFPEDEEKIKLVIISKGLVIPENFDWGRVRESIRKFAEKF